MRTIGLPTGLLALSVAAAPEPAAADTIIPVDQNRYVSTENVNAPQCSGDFFCDHDAAERFEPFDSLVETVHGCDSGLAFASAGQQSQIDPASMSGLGSAYSEAHGPVPGVVHAFGISFFEVTFRLSSVVNFALDGVISAGAFDDPAVGAFAQIKLTGPDQELIFEQVVEPGPGGETTSRLVEEFGVLEPGQYVLQAQAGTFIDNDVPPSRLAQASYDFTFDASLLGDLDGDGTVGILDLLLLLAAWGPCPERCPPFCTGDLDRDCTVGIGDLLLLLANWG